MGVTSALLLKVSLVVFMAGNLLDMGLRLKPGDALRGLRDLRFVGHALLWGFVLGPALAYAITRIVPMDYPYAMGLILVGMTPCAPFLPMIVDKTRGDLGYTAAIMMLAAIGTVAFMPFAIPQLIDGLSVSAWRIARPLLLLIFLPLAIGMLIRLAAPAFGELLQPIVRRTAGVATLATGVMILVLYGRDLAGIPGSLALAAQLLFFSVVTLVTYGLGFGLAHEKRMVLTAGMTTRNLGAAVAPLLSIAEIDQRAIVMVVLSLPVMVLYARLGTWWFERHLVRVRDDGRTCVSGYRRLRLAGFGGDTDQRGCANSWRNMSTTGWNAARLPSFNSISISCALRIAAAEHWVPRSPAAAIPLAAALASPVVACSTRTSAWSRHRLRSNWLISCWVENTVALGRPWDLSSRAMLASRPITVLSMKVARLRSITTARTDCPPLPNHCSISVSSSPAVSWRNEPESRR